MLSITVAILVQLCGKSLAQDVQPSFMGYLMRPNLS
jgi:hypothetical protein